MAVAVGNELFIYLSKFTKKVKDIPATYAEISFRIKSSNYEKIKIVDLIKLLKRIHLNKNKEKF